MRNVTNLVHLRIIEKSSVRASASTSMNIGSLCKQEHRTYFVSYPLSSAFDVDLQCVESLRSLIRYTYLLDH